MARVDWAIDARVDLRLIRDYIARNSPTNAHNFHDRLVAATERLKAFPESGRIVPELEHPQVREVIVVNYRIVYRLKRDVVTVVAVLHGHQDLLTAASERRWKF